jgi:uncharacterized sulfatase
LAKLLGGVDAMGKAAETALAEGDAQWALELATKVLRLEPADAGARATRIGALRALGWAQGNACARNYYLLSARQEEAEQG